MATPSLRLTYKVKDWFFDRQKVIDAIGRDTAKALSKVGAFVRKRARSSLRRRKGTSKPGRPPNVHSNDPTTNLKNILFGLEKTHKRTVVVGPVLLNGSRNTSPTVPEVHERGGRMKIRESQAMRNGVPISPWRTWEIKRPPPGWTYRRRVRDAVYPPRPIMQPALDAERKAGTIRQAFAGGLTGKRRAA